MRKNDLARAIHMNLSGLEWNAEMRAKVIQGIGEKRPTKRKMRSALIVAIITLLLAAGALATILLSGRDFVSDVMAPAAIETETDSWTQKEMNELLAKAESAGVVLDADTLARLSQMDSVYKEELMRLFMKLDLGFYPSSWPLEDQVWYEQIQVELGLKTPDEVARFYPEEGELTLEDAVSIAQATIRTQYGEQADLTDETIYLRHVTYQNLTSMEGQEGKGWYVEYQARDLLHDGYVVNIWPDGTVFDPQVFPGVGSDEAPAEPSDLENRYFDVYGMWYDWEPETFVKYHESLAKSVQAHPDAHITRFMRAMLIQTYGIPTDDAPLKEDAIEAGIRAVVEGQKIPQEEVLLYGVYAVYLLGEEVPVWKVAVPQQDVGNWTVELNAYTGEVRRVVLGEYGTLEIHAFYLQSVIDALPVEEEKSVG